MTRMPKPFARCATSWPMRPKPRMPSVFSYSSVPELLLAPLEPQLDVEVRAQKLHPRVADLLLAQPLQALPLGAGSGCRRARSDAGVRRVRAHGASLSTTQSTQLVSACTSAGS